MTISKKFDWPAIDETEFEELVLEIAKAMGAIHVELRKGPGDKGRDVQATFRNRDAIGVETQDRYFFEAKHHKGGVSPDHIAPALAWAQAEQPHSLVLVASSHFTNPCKENLAAWGKNNPNVVVSVWERPRVEEILLSDDHLKTASIRLGLLPPEIVGLLPPNPEDYRPAESEIGLEMPFRYWLTQEEVNSLDDVAGFIEHCAEILRENDLSNKYFETVELGANNWSTWLRLMQAQCMLEIAVRDYLFAQVSGKSTVELSGLADIVRKQVSLVSEVGSSSYHTD